MVVFRAGWHVAGQGGHRGTLGDYISALANAGHRPVINAVDDAGLAVEAANAGGIVVYRKTEWSAAPDYALTAEEAALTRWAGIKALIPPEIVAIKDKVLIEPTNEPDRNRADWLGRFMLTLATAANADGYRIAGLSWATGNPEVAHWEEPGMLDYLRYVAANPTMNAISLHEYSLDENDITAMSPWLVGRYQFLLEVCAAHDIPEPPIIITEAGWSYRSMPTDSEVMTQIDWLARQYGAIPFALWTLGSGSQWGDLPQRLSGYVDDLTAWMLANSEPEEEEEPPPTLAELIWSAGVASKKISHNPKASLGAAIRADEYWPLGDETGVQAGDVAYRVQLGKYPEGNVRRAYFVKVPKWGEVFYVEEGGDVQVWGAGGGPSVWLDVPYLSQWTPSANLSSGDCGPACVAMIANFYGRNVTVNQAAAACGQPPGSNSTSITQLRNGLGYYGVTNVYQRPATLDYLRQQLDAGNPIIILLHYGSLTGNQDTFTGGHFFVAVGYGTDGDGEYFLVNDSNFWGSRITQGDHRRISAGELSLAMDDATRDGNYARQVIVATGRTVTPPPPPAPTIDLLPYFDPVNGGNGPLYELRRPDGSQERIQHQSDPSSNRFYIVKGSGGIDGRSEWEQLAADDFHIWRGLDTSPGGGRYYKQFEPGLVMAKWCKRHMAIGETFTGPGHNVQFYFKVNCAESAANSGTARNVITLVTRHDSQTWNGVTVNDVIELTNGTERWFFSRGVGMVAWSSPWGSSAISEIHAPGSRPDNVTEVIPCL